MLDRWRRYGEALFKKPADEQTLVRAAHDVMEPLPLLHEVEAAITRLSNDKAPGVDGISAELIKHSGRPGALVLHRVVCRIWETCIWPDDWRTQEFIPLYKAGDRKECSN